MLLQLKVGFFVKTLEIVIITLLAKRSTNHSSTVQKLLINF